MDSNRTQFRLAAWTWRPILASLTGLVLCTAGNHALAQSNSDDPPVAVADSANRPDDTNRETSEQLFALAAGHYASGDWAEAIEYFERLVREYPQVENAGSARFYMGESLMQLGKFAAAEAMFLDFLQRSPESASTARARFRVAECQYLGGERPQALTGFRDFLTDYDADPLAEYALAYLAELQFETGDVSAARDSYEQALNRFPGSSLSDKCRLGLAQSLQQLGQHQQAERFFNFIIEQPQNELADDALIMSARMWAAAGRWNLCRQRVEELQSQYPASSLINQSRYLMAKAWMAERDWAASWEILETLIDQSWPDDQFAHIGLDAALVALRLDKPGDAARLIDRVRQATGDAALLEFAAALEIDLATRQADLNQLESLVDRFRETWPQSTWLARGIESLARELYSSGKYRQSADRYSQLVSLAETRQELQSNRDAWRYLQGLSLIGCSEFADAAGQLQAIVEFDGDPQFEGATALALATSYSGAGDYAQAIGHYQRYLELSPEGEDVVRCYADMASAQVQCGQLDEALQTITHALPAGQNDRSVLSACESIAEMALTEKRPETARDFFRLMAQSDDPDFARRGATGLIWSGDQESIQTGQVDELLQQDDPSMVAEALLAQAQRLQASDQHDDARQLLEKIINLGPQSPLAVDAAIRLAISLHKTGGLENRERAESLLAGCLQQHPDHPLSDLAWYELGWIQLDAKNPEPARAAFLTIVDKHSDSRYWADALYRTATISRQLDDDPGAISCLTRLVESRPDEGLATYAHQTLGEIAVDQCDWATAIRHFEKVQSGSTDESLRTPALYWMAECYYQNGQTAIAERHFRSLRDSGVPNSRTASAVVLRLAQCAARRDDWVGVNKILIEARQSTPGLVEGYQFDYLQARVLMSQAKFAEARQLLESVLNNPAAQATQTAAMSQWLIGESWFHQQDYASALRGYLLVDSLYDYPEWRALALLQAAKCQWRMDKPESADKTIERLLNGFPESRSRDRGPAITAANASGTITPQNHPGNFFQTRQMRAFLIRLIISGLFLWIAGDHLAALAEEPGTGVDIPGVVAPDNSGSNIIASRRLLEVVRNGGPMMIPIGVCSFILLVFVFERAISLRKGRIIPRPFVKRFLEQLNDGALDREEALQRCEKNSSHVSRVFAAGARKWGKPSVEVEQAVLDAGERVSNDLRKYLRLINGIATVCPLLGLLGTVLGMIQAFDAIAAVDPSQADPKLLIATGISQALLTTAAGMTVAIPAIIAYLYFTGRVDQRVIEIDGLGQQLVAQISAEAITQDRTPARGRNSAKKPAA